MAGRTRVLFLCTGNSCRSQMAEGFLRALGGERFESLSAGSKPAGYVHPRAIAVMREVGIEIGAGRSKSIGEFVPPAGQPPELVIAVCESAARECPIFPGNVERWSWPFDDPAKVKGSETEIEREFRRVRDEIRERIERELLGRGEN